MLGGKEEAARLSQSPRWSRLGEEEQEEKDEAKEKEALKWAERFRLILCRTQGFHEERQEEAEEAAAQRSSTGAEPPRASSPEGSESQPSPCTG